MRRAVLAALVAVQLAVLALTAGAAAPAPSASPTERWALLVGVTHYQGTTHDTVGGAADARLVRDVLLRNGWRSDHIRLLTDGQATAAAVGEGLRWLQGRSSASTFSLFHYSGHVKQRGGHEYLWPVDNRFLLDSDVGQAMRAVRGTSWTSISGCEAAGFDEGISSSSHLFTASSRVDEKSYEDPHWGTSVWAGLLWAQGLRDKKADSDRDGGVSVQEALHWAAPQATQYTSGQSAHGPQHPQSRGFSGSLRLDRPRTLR